LNTPDNVDIDAPEAWAVTTGSSSTIVAVLDTGVDLTNPAFAGRLWVNPAASKPHSAVFGWNFVSNNGNVQDNNGHGTHVTGVLAATGNDGQGVVGVNWHAEIMPLKILDSTGSGTLSAAVSAVYFAANHGARVINASWGSSSPDPALADAIRYADQKGVVFVNAAGNDGVNNDVVPTYPAAYHTPNMLVVAAIDQSGQLASFSNFGPQTVDLAAPGVDILSTYPRKFGSYAYLSGTSMATPFVSGVVSLLASLHPDWTAEQLVQRVVATTKPLPGLAGRSVSGGMVDAAQAIGVAGSGPNGDHYTGPPPVVKTTANPHPTSGTTSHRTPRKPIKRHSIAPLNWAAIQGPTPWAVKYKVHVHGSPSRSLV
jgi:subtilisin family serine protease